LSLKEYTKKRKLGITREPPGIKKSSGKKLHFVVQKHSASHLHYDFRLEMEGVLKSWALPKGPSTNPAEKRLAVNVEDHPYDYKDFEGAIPKGEYGGGEVIIWDKGTYHSVETKNTEESEKLLFDGLKKGHISFILDGKKLKGEFALVQMKKRGKNTWLLLKKNDEFASSEDILKNAKSVVSGKTIEDLKNGTPKKSKNIV